MKEQIKKNYRKIIVYIVFGILYTLAMIYLTMSIGIDSDKANHLLQAQDILKGNFFLKDWNLTGVSFWTTDLIYYEIGYILGGGIGYRAICIAVGLMISSWIILCFIVSMTDNKNKKYMKIILFLLLLAIPSKDYRVTLRVHTGAIFLSLLSLLFFYFIVKSFDEKKLDERKKIYVPYVGLILCIVFGIVGDMLTAILAVVPLCIYAFLYVLRSSEKKNNIKYWKLLGIIVCSTIGGLVFNKIFYMVGNANKNSYIGDLKFPTVEGWGDNFTSFIDSLLSLNGASVNEQQISSVWNIPKMANMLIMLVSLIIIIVVLYRFIANKEVDTLSVLISLSILMASGAFIFTTISESRYITFIPGASIVLIIRNYDTIISLMANKKLWSICIIAVSSISFAGKVKEVSEFSYPSNNIDQYELIQFLEENELYNGYASFWSASTVTILSKEKVKVRHIMDRNNIFTMQDWFCKNEWYDEDTHFILIDNQDQTDGASDFYGVSLENIEQYFGEPSEILSFKQYMIIVYDESISPELASMEKGDFIPKKLIATGEVSRTEDEIVLAPGGAAFSPNLPLQKGEYTVTYTGNDLTHATAEIIANKEEDVFWEVLDKTENEITLKLTAKRTLQNIEIKITNSTSDNITISQINLK